MSCRTSTKTDCCIRRFSDLSLEVHKSISCEPLGSPDPMSAEFDPLAYLGKVLLSKHPSIGQGNDEETRASLAIAKLLASDERCKIINETGFLQSDIVSPWMLNGILLTAQSLIGNLLSGFTHSLFEHCNYSNGASQGFKLQDAAPYKKFAGRATVTAPVQQLARQIIKSDPAWMRLMQDTYGDDSSWFRLVYGNGLFTVPKNNEIDRAACKEPDVNMYLQKGAGAFIRRRLRTVGIDLNDQSLNQELARLGSIDGSLATLDMSSASDSISTYLVLQLLPQDMFDYLDLIRSKFSLVDGKIRRWNLFSTMGNGFTFELESLIFWALSKAVVTHLGLTGNIGIYGDDIIVPVDAAPLLLEVLRVVGFIPNKDKSFYSGYFRESCGAFYYKGVDVKPFYIKRPIDDLPSLMLILNRIRGWGNAGGMADPRLFPIWAKLSLLVPDELKGGCDVARSDYLVSPEYPRKRLAQMTRTLNGFSNSFGIREDGGRYVAWHHNGSGEILQTIVSDRYALRRNSEWSTPIPLFPQEV
ncbi:RNA-directed RNA polymerase [ssRNA phage AVE017]|uniref:RNA-directed RNA polymerase n=1 Tax=ssRNA phage AVE017 TaxID=2785989 RepID=A0A8S5KXJ7_9VIRU|nr:RNA-directed RNA polymerase [ssRNA phage AVE017]DAD49859.1 TPA_asm: RNA-directed RNA polymerase [ssRNA phage AVE017]